MNRSQKKNSQCLPLDMHVSEVKVTAALAKASVNDSLGSGSLGAVSCHDSGTSLNKCTEPSSRALE